MKQTDARTRLLEATEQVLLEDGLSALSVRRVTALAGMNVNAVSYNFGSKEALLRALMFRIMEPTLVERARRLREVAETPGHTVEDLVAAFLWPLVHADAQRVALFVELGIKPRLDKDERFEQTREDVVQSGIAQIVTALGPLLADLPTAVIAFRVETMLEMAVIHVWGRTHLAEKYGLCGGEDEQHLIDDVVGFFSAALAAPTALCPVDEAQ